MEININQIISSLMELEAKGCHSVYFEYADGLFKVRIFKGAENTENVVYERTINPVTEEKRLVELFNRVHDLKIHVKNTVFQCYKQEFVKGKISEWVKTGSTFEFGDNATSSMLIDGSGYYIDDPDNNVLYFVDMKHVSETNP